MKNISIIELQEDQLDNINAAGWAYSKKSLLRYLKNPIKSTKTAYKVIVSILDKYNG